MFTIKNYSPNSFDYEAYSSKTYRVERGPVSSWTSPDGTYGTPPMNTHLLTLDDGRIITVFASAYIENLDGKTIDTIRSKPVELQSLGNANVAAGVANVEINRVQM